MRKRFYFYTTAVIFSFIALAHFLRVIREWNVNIDGVSIPVWLSLVAILAAGVLAYYGWRFSTASSGDKSSGR